MVRKHSGWARSRMTRSRPKTPAPKHGLLMSELSQISGVPVRRLRDYVFRDLIQPIERRGTATRYARSQLVRVLAIKRMRGELGLELAEIRRRMDAMGERELEAWITSAPLPDEAMVALGRKGPDVAGAQAPSPQHPWPADVASPRVADGSNDTGTGQAMGAGAHAAATWYHVQLLPGLVLQLNANASPAVKNAAKRIVDEYVGP